MFLLLYLSESKGGSRFAQREKRRCKAYVEGVRAFQKREGIIPAAAA